MLKHCDVSGKAGEPLGRRGTAWNTVGWGGDAEEFLDTNDLARMKVT